jgi:hypothetical protein
VRGVRHGAQLHAQAFQGRRRDGIGETRGQLPACRRFHSGKHIGRPASEEIAHHEFGCDRNSYPLEFVRGCRCSDLFTVDQDTVAIENDHGIRPTAPSDVAQIRLSDESRRLS